MSIEVTEANLREILAKTQYELRKDDESFRFKVEYNVLRCRYEVQVLMGRQEFEEIYIFKDQCLAVPGYGKYFYDDWINQIKTNLKLNRIYNKV